MTIAALGAAAIDTAASGAATQDAASSPPAAPLPPADKPAERPARLRPALAAQTRRTTASLPPGAWQLQASQQLRLLAQVVQQEQEAVVIELGAPGDDADSLRGDSSLLQDCESLPAADTAGDAPPAVEPRATTASGLADRPARDRGHDDDANADDSAEAARPPPAGDAASIVEEVNRHVRSLPELRSPAMLVEAVLTGLHARGAARTARLVLLGHWGDAALADTPTGLAQVLAVVHALALRPGTKRLLLPPPPEGDRERLVVPWAPAHGFVPQAHEALGAAVDAHPMFDGEAREEAMAAAISGALSNADVVVAAAATLHLAGLHRALALDHETITLALVAPVAPGDDHAALRLREVLRRGIVAMRPSPALEAGRWASPPEVDAMVTALLPGFVA